MRDYAIAPTAQRLAEENNVDWRMLTGSGEGGSVVERDVLGYLARVMRGEEATNPTPEPLPEGLSAWPEEPERRRTGATRTTERTANRTGNRAPASPPKPSTDASKTADDFSEPFSSTSSTPRAKAATRPEAEAHTPWTVEKPAKAAPEVALQSNAEALSNGADKTFFKPAELTPATPVTAESKQAAAPPEAVTVAQPQPLESSPTPAKVDVSDAHRAALAELETLRAYVTDLEEDRKRHVNELHQLSRMQETIALQKTESAKLGALQGEVRDLKAQLATAQRASERVEALAAHNRDLEARLVRARTFKSKAKAEFERITEDNMMLEHELADLKQSRRGLFRKGR